MAVKDTPASAGGFPAGSGDLIMHAELKKDSLYLMASDMLMGEIRSGNQIELMLNCSSEEELHTFFNALSQGGKVNQPVRTEFWGAVFGQLVDRFGIGWMLNYGKS
jgi:PhnB protein